MDITQMFWVLFVVLTVWPMLKQQTILRAHVKPSRAIEIKRK